MTFASRSISRPFPGFASLYHLGTTGSNQPFHGHLELATREEAFALTRAEMTPPGPIQARHYLGRKKPGDVIWTTWAIPLLVSERVISIVRDAGFTGWRAYDVELVGHDGAAIPGYYGLAIHGRCGPIDESRAVEIWERMPGGIVQRWWGMHFDPDTWDGSDFFMPDAYVGTKLVTQEVKRALEKAKVKNLCFTPLNEAEVIKL